MVITDQARDFVRHQLTAASSPAVSFCGTKVPWSGVAGSEMQKAADAEDISVLFFSAGANCWAILSHFWAILDHFGSFLCHFGPFGVIFGPLCAILGLFWPILGHFVAFLDKFAESSIFLRDSWGPNPRF